MIIFLITLSRPDSSVTLIRKPLKLNILLSCCIGFFKYIFYHPPIIVSNDLVDITYSSAEGTPIALRRLVLAALFRGITHVSLSMHEIMHRAFPFGPFWTLRAWISLYFPFFKWGTQSNQVPKHRTPTSLSLLWGLSFDEPSSFFRLPKKRLHSNTFWGYFASIPPMISISVLFVPPIFLLSFNSFFQREPTKLWLSVLIPVPVNLPLSLTIPAKLNYR